MIKALIIITIFSSTLNAKEFLSGRVEEPSKSEQYHFNQDTLTNSCNKNMEPIK